MQKFRGALRGDANPGAILNPDWETSVGSHVIGQQSPDSWPALLRLWTELRYKVFRSLAARYSRGLMPPARRTVRALIKAARRGENSTNQVTCYSRHVVPWNIHETIDMSGNVSHVSRVINLGVSFHLFCLLHGKSALVTCIHLSYVYTHWWADVRCCIPAWTDPGVCQSLPSPKTCPRQVCF
jgi:hypothetical protein